MWWWWWWWCRYYLAEIGVAMSPLTDNKNSLEESAFYDMYRVGLKTSLSTNSPILHHITNEPLLEEYAIAAQVYYHDTYFAELL
jgi:AMP deaminase